MPLYTNIYMVVGDNSDYGNFKIEYSGLDLFIENTHDERYTLKLSKDDWIEMKKFIDFQFENK